MVGRWLPWIAAAAVLGVFIPPLVSAPPQPLISAPSVKTSPATGPETQVSELIEPPPMTGLAESKSSFFEPSPAGNFEPPSAGDEEAKPQPQRQIAVNAPSPPAARDHSGRQSASRHVALHHRIYRRICCIPPVYDKAGN